MFQGTHTRARSQPPVQPGAPQGGVPGSATLQDPEQAEVGRAPQRCVYSAPSRPPEATSQLQASGARRAGGRPVVLATGPLGPGSAAPPRSSEYAAIPPCPQLRSSPLAFTLGIRKRTPRRWARWLNSVSPAAGYRSLLRTSPPWNTTHNLVQVPTAARFSWVSTHQHCFALLFF